MEQETTKKHKGRPKGAKDKQPRKSRKREADGTRHSVFGSFMDRVKQILKRD